MVTIEEVDGLSDDAVRTALMDLGQTVGPVTGTTRSVYVNRLKVALGGGKTDSLIESTDSVLLPSAIPVLVKTVNAASSPSKIPPVRGEKNTDDGVDLSDGRPSTKKTPKQFNEVDFLHREANINQQRAGQQFTTIREKPKLDDSSSDDNDFRGEESSRYISSHESSVYFPSPASVGMTPLHSGQTNGISIIHKQKAFKKGKNKRAIILGLLVVVLTVFGFFVIQNIAAVRSGEANYEEL